MKGILVSRDLQYLFLGKCEMLDFGVLIIQVTLTILRRPYKGRFDILEDYTY